MLLCYHLLVKRDEYHSLVVKRGVCVVFCVVFCVGGALLHQLKPNIRGYTLCVEYTTVYDVIVSKTQLIYFPYCLYTQGRKRENVNRGEYVLFFVLVALCCWALVGKWEIGMVYIPTSIHPYIHTFMCSSIHK